MLNLILLADSLILTGRGIDVYEKDSFVVIRNYSKDIHNELLEGVFISKDSSVYRKGKLFGFITIHEDTVKIYSKRTIAVVVDAGHGGEDFGAIGLDGVMEKDITLSVALKLYDILNEKGYKAVLTRSKDEFVSLFQRRRIIDGTKAKYKIYVSLHCNFMSNTKAWGLETYFLSTSRVNTKRAVEIIENMGYEEEGMEEDVKAIVGDYLQNIYLMESKQLAFFIHKALKKYTKDRGIRQANFYVLRRIYFPSVLVELGYISNPHEVVKLSDENYQTELAKNIALGIDNFIRWKFKTE